MLSIGTNTRHDGIGKVRVKGLKELRLVKVFSGECMAGIISICMYICIHIYIYIYICTYLHICMYTYIFI
jgi:hypothetical protein